MAGGVGSSAISHGWTYVSLLFALAAAILIVTGIDKIIRPNPTARVLTASGLIGNEAPLLARLLGSIEVGVGSVALVSPRPLPALLVAGLYGIFGGFLVFLAKFRSGMGSCGCLGAKDIPPNLVHAAIDLLASLVSLAIVRHPQQALLNSFGNLGWVGLPILAILAATTYSLYGLIAYVPGAFRSFAAPPVASRQRGRDREARIDEIFRQAGIGPRDPSLWGGIRLTPSEAEAQVTERAPLA